jgi:hypothetical protein
MIFALLIVMQCRKMATGQLKHAFNQSTETEGLVSILSNCKY